MRMDYIPPTRRLRVLNAIIVALISVLVGRLWQIQVLQGRQFLRLSEENRIRDYTITAPRGVIYDRKGRPLVSNRPSFTVAILPLELIEPVKVLPHLAALIGLPIEEIRGRIEANRNRPFEPVRIRRDVGAGVVATIEENRLDLPGVIILAEPVRHYLYGQMGAHVSLRQHAGRPAYAIEFLPDGWLQNGMSVLETHSFRRCRFHESGSGGCGNGAERGSSSGGPCSPA